MSLSHTLARSLRAVMLVLLASCPALSFAQRTPVPAAVAYVSPAPGSVGYVTYSGGSSITAQIGRWDTPYPYPDTGQYAPGLQPVGFSSLAIDVDVNDGGLVTFRYFMQTYDAGVFDWYDVFIETPVGNFPIATRLGKPGSAYGTYWASPSVPITQSLDRWRNQRVRFIFRVMQDGWGDQTQGQVLGFKISSCSVAPLTPVTDPVASNFEAGNTIDVTNMTAQARLGLDCLRTAVSAVGGTFSLSSAYRPVAYQARWIRWPPAAACTARGLFRIPFTTSRSKGVSMNTSKLLAAATLLASLAASAGPRDDEVAAVTVYKEAQAAGVVYTYTVTNRATLPIIGLTVGYDFYSGDVQLAGSRPTVLQAPNGWAGMVVSLEDSDRFEVQWEITSVPGGLAAGQSAVFKATVPMEAAGYTAAHWTVLVDGPPVNVSAPLQIVQGPGAGDTVAPSISVSLSPAFAWPPNKQMISVTATVNVSDNLDPSPLIKLVSIRCTDCTDPINDIQDAAIGTDDRVFMLRADRTGKDKVGRVYQVTYSATDRSGNTSFAEVLFTVPHDQRN